MNIILVDAEHLDRVTFNLIVNFERMLERRIRGTTARPSTATNDTGTSAQTPAKPRRTARTDSMNNMGSM